MVKAIVAIEDYRFYEHGAIDLKGTLRALITNKASGEQVQGGSSITQQMVKLTLISQAKNKEERLAATDETYARKLRELRYAIAVEEQHSKDWILERYLNIAYFGDGAYGIQAAAKHYFGVNAKKLNLRQSALLAGLVKNPNGYDPTRFPDLALERRNVVIERMAELSVITPQLAEQARSRGLGLDVQPQPNGCLDSSAQFFCDYVMAYLLEDKDLGKNRKEREQLLKTGGLTIHTTMRPKYQAAAQASVDRHVFAKDRAVGGLAMVQPGTGEVLGLAQSRPMGFNAKKGETFVNFAIPKELGGSAGFQPGSTFKVFVLSAALKQGIPLDYTIQAPSQISVNKSEFTDCGGSPTDYGPYDPTNSTSSGPMTLYTGTRESVNTFFIQLEAATGLCEPFRLAKKMGVNLTNPKPTKQNPNAERVPSFTLGVTDASPLEMAEAYATFGARGKHCDSTPVTLIDDADGNPLKEYAPQCQQVLETGVADAVNAVLRGVQEPGGFGYGAGLGLRVPSAAKTGTTQNQRAVWFAGYTPQVAAVSMVAGMNAAGQPISLQSQTVGGRYISQAFGSTVAGPEWADAMQAIDDGLKTIDFQTPDLSGIAPRGYTPVPSVTGMSVSSAITVLHSAGLKASVDIHVTKTFSESETVVQSYPSAGSPVIVNGMVLLVPASNGPPPPKKGNKGGGGGRGGGGGGRGGGGGGRG
jgi:membrane peptidoglycan carboxypeptidase